MMSSNTKSSIIYTRNILRDLGKLIAPFSGNVFLLTETTAEKYCLPALEQLIAQYRIPNMAISPGETNKSVRSVEKVWEFLSRSSADRKSLLINVGGGMLTDLGGFAASTFKRGIAFINVPTTLLAQVDASIGGKTGINYNGLKNEIGIFNEPVAVLIDTGFLKTLDRGNFLSGYAEMLKHGLIRDAGHWNELMQYDLEQTDYEALREIIAHSVAIKEWHVVNDPTEKNIRKALNFGHTVGHAFESYALYIGRPILHGYAVAYGMIAELYLSSTISGFDRAETDRIARWLSVHYGKFEITPHDYEPLYELMTHDKKNENSRINFTLLSTVGQAHINQNCSKEPVLDALEYFRTEGWKN